jgi:hypothetical protein
VQSPIYEAQFKNQSKSKPNKKKKLAGRAYVMSLSFALFPHMIYVTFLTPIPKTHFGEKLVLCFSANIRLESISNFKFSLYSISSHNSLSYVFQISILLSSALSQF